MKSSRLFLPSMHYITGLIVCTPLHCKQQVSNSHNVLGISAETCGCPVAQLQLCHPVNLTRLGKSDSWLYLAIAVVYLDSGTCILRGVQAVIRLMAWC